MVVDPPASIPVAATPRPYTGWAWWFGLTATITLVADLVSKDLIFRIPNDRLPFWVQHAYNPGVAWSMLADQPWLVVGLTVVLIPILVVVWWRQYRLLGPLENFAFGLILGGAVGNAVDRIAMRLDLVHGVRDFIHVDLGFPPFNPWPTFNLADSGICIGFAVLLLISFRQPKTC